MWQCASRGNTRHDIQAEQTLVREKWQLVHANSIKADNAMKALLTEGLDVCCQTVAYAAFDLVRRVLKPKGYVRRDHTGELTNFSAVMRNADSDDDAFYLFLQKGKIRLDGARQEHTHKVGFYGCLEEEECCLLVLNAVASTPQWIRQQFQPKAAWGCVCL
jgi:hypothetical protein